MKTNAELAAEILIAALSKGSAAPPVEAWAEGFLLLLETINAANPQAVQPPHSDG